jgi:hypothetical protein
MKRVLFLLTPITLGILAVAVNTFVTQKVIATEKASVSSAVLTPVQIAPNDQRVQILRSYISQFDPLLAKSAPTFVAEADKYNLDWRLVAAISGVESTFGKQIPEGSYNAWGWGIYGDNRLGFSSYDEGISVISKSLREKYVDQWGAKDVYEIGTYYAASPTWATRVAYFMRKIDQYETSNPSETLSLSL